MKSSTKQKFAKVLAFFLIFAVLFNDIAMVLTSSRVFAAASVTPSSETEDEVIQDFNSLPELLVTEIMANNDGADQFEYFEVHNNSDQSIVLDHYQFALRYTNGSGNPDVQMDFSPVTLGSNETIVFWLNGKNLPLEDFNKHYNTNLSDEQIIEYSGAPGFYNSGERAVVIKDGNGEDIVWANYLKDEIASGKVVEYQFPNEGIEMAKYLTVAEPTPGQVVAEQLPAEPVIMPANAEPTIEHEPVEEIVAGQDFVLDASITDDSNDMTATVYYQSIPSENYQKLVMDLVENSTYQAVVPKEAIQSDTFSYYIVVTDSNNRVTVPTSMETPIEVSVSLDEVDYNSYPHLLITEISPNSEGGGTDYYEFFELYNNTNQPQPLTKYSFVYLYTDSGKEVVFQVPAVTLQPQEQLVLWFNKGERTLADFNANFETNLTSEQVVEYKSVFPGFANGGNRAIVIKDNEANEIISASYLGEDNDNSGVDIHYQYPVVGTEMVKEKGAATPTPGVIEPIQVPTTPVTLPDTVEDQEAPSIVHTPVAESSSYSPVNIEATITDNMAVPIATLHYKEKGADTFTSIAMQPSVEDPSTYTAEIPSTSVESDVVYYIEATDGTNDVKTDEHTILVDKVVVDFDTIPAFLVTEIVPDTDNIGGSDGFEFIEIYNNTNKDINFKDYKLNYRYDKDPSRDVVWSSVPDDVVIPAGDTLVFWIINAKNGHATVDDFNANYSTNLVENEDIVRIYSGGMANGGARGLVVKTNAGKEITVSYYNDEANNDDTLPNKGIVFKYPEDGSVESLKVSAALEDATPGTVQSFQVPEQPVQFENDTVDPVLENSTTINTVNEKENINIVAAVTDNKEVVSVRLYYKTNNQTEYKNVILQADNDQLYRNLIYSPELIGREKLAYYFEVSDGVNEVTSETFEISITSEFDNTSLRQNIKDEEFLTGNVIVKGTSAKDNADVVKLYIDGKEQLENTYQSLERTAYFAYEVNGLNTYFKNAITMGDELLFMMDQDWLSDWKTFSIPIEPDSLQIGENTITVRSGNKASPYDLESSENRDNYDLRNVRLVLSDGTVLQDPKFNDPTRSIGMNDGNPFEHFTFTITKEHADSKTYLWDTTTMSDGEHVVVVEDTDEEVSATVKVDNTAPVVETTIEEGKTYKGAFTIDVDAEDVIAGIENVEVKLDDQEIAIPYETASSILTPGDHNLTVKATDQVGNVQEVSVNFSVVDENPNYPKLELPADDRSNAVDGDPKLKVTVTDPMNDEVNVTFYQGYKYNANQTDYVKAFKNSTDTEPPQTMVPAGEQAFTAEDIAQVSEIDNNYLTTDSDTQFPYHRFDVTVDDSVSENDIVELVWQGKSLEGRKVSMYAWSHEENDWTLIDYNVAGEEDFELKANVAVGEFVKDSKVNVLIQDEIPSSPEEYDYTFVWMTDTQYYAESYPHIFERQTQWIAEKKDELKIEYVFHTGDLVDEADKEYQWNHADEYMGTLDENEIPYGVLAGNHDVGGVNNDYTAYYNYFGEDRFENKPYYGGSYLNNRGHYDLMSVGGNDFIMLYLGWDVTDEGIAWMNEVLAAHPDKKAILNFHEYLLATGTRHPLGEKLYNEIVVPNENVIAVLSGHYHEAQTYVDEIDDNNDGTPDRKVYQMLADYQAGPEGGQGYMRLLHFDQDNNRVVVNTYSPYMDDYNYYDTESYPGKDEFVMDLDLSVQEKRVATDYFSVNVYSDTVIGKESNVSSGDTAEVTWSGLEEGKTYSWYTVISDEFTGKTTSDIWTFVKGEGEETTTPPEDNEEEPSESEKPGDNQNPGEGTDNEKDVVNVVPVNEDGVLKINDDFDELLAPSGKLQVNMSNNDSVLTLTEKQINSLIAKNASLVINNRTIEIMVPAINFGANGEVTINISKLNDLEAARSSVYDLTITQGSGTISDFTQPVTLTFKVTGEVENPNMVNVYYYNEDLEQWELIGGSYQDGFITVTTDHFSIFTVLTSDKEVISTETPIVEDKEKSNDDSEGEELPDTATSTFNIIAFGFALLIIGLAAAFIVANRRNRKTI